MNRVRKAVPCPGNAREDFRIVVEMAAALGASWPEYGTPEEAWDEFADLSPLWSGIRYDRIEEVGLQWPCTDREHPGTPYLHAPHPARPSGKGKFYPVEYQPPIEQPDSEYPFVLSTGRTLYHYNSATMTMREEGVTQKQEDPFVEMHPEDAQALGVADDDWVRLVSRRGELEARAKLGDRVYPGLVWMALHFAEAKVNWLTHDVGDPLIGTPGVQDVGGASRAARRRGSAGRALDPALYGVSFQHEAPANGRSCTTSTATPSSSRAGTPTRPTRACGATSPSASPASGAAVAPPAG